MTGLDPSELWPRATPADWLATVSADLEGADPEALNTPIEDGVEMQPLFGRSDLPPVSAASTPTAKFIAAPMQLALRVGPEPGQAIPALPDGFGLLRLSDPELESHLAAGETARVRALDPAQHVLTLSANPSGVRALATLERTGLPHHVVLDVVDRVDGESPARELALTLAAVVDVMRGFGEGAQPRPGALAERLMAPVCIGTDLVTQIAKARAARWLWHSVMTAFEVEPPRRRARVWAKASVACYSAVDPQLNLVRGALQMFAAASADTDVFEPLLHDPVGNPNESARLAANQLRLLHHEAEAQRVRDPAGGAFAVESLTTQIAQQAWRLLQAIESRGGASRTNHGLDALAASAPAERVLVGTNRFADPRAEVTASPATTIQRHAAPYENLRRRTAHQSIDALVLPFGEPGSARAHAEWAVDLLHTAGIEPIVSPRCASPAQARDEIGRHQNIRLLVCCGLDDASGTFVRSVLTAIADRPQAPLLYATGTTPPASETWGPVGFLHRDLDTVGTLSGILDRLRVGSP